MTAMQDLAQGRAKAKESPLTAARRLSFGRAHLRGLAAVVVFVLIWQVGANTGLLGRGSLASPLESFRVFVQDYLGRPGYWEGWLVSVQRVLAGFLIAQVIGIPLGILFGISRRARQIVFPVFEILRPIPPLAWVPLAILLLPGSESAVIFVTFLVAFFATVVNTVLGVDSIDRNYFRAAACLGASRRAVLFDVILPGALPNIFTGLQIAMGAAWFSLAAGEMIAAQFGLGYLIWEAYNLIQYPTIVIGMGTLGLLGYLSSALIRRVGHALMAWRASALGAAA